MLGRKLWIHRNDGLNNHEWVWTKVQNVQKNWANVGRIPSNFKWNLPIFLMYDIKCQRKRQELNDNCFRKYHWFDLKIEWENVLKIQCELICTDFSTFALAESVWTTQNGKYVDVVERKRGEGGERMSKVCLVLLEKIIWWKSKYSNI